MDNKLGIYICTGCGIGEKVDLEELTEVVDDELNVAVCKNHNFLCDREGVQIITDDIENEGINKVIIAACSNRVNWDVFNFGPNVLLDRVNLREHVVWSHTAEDEEEEEDIQMMAADYLRMSAAKVKKSELPEPHIPENMSKDVLVVGGGITGMQAALEASRAGYGVHLVEKTDSLGGWMNTQFKTFAPDPPYIKLVDSDPSAMIKEVEESDKITVHLSSNITKIAGAPGIFDVTLQHGDKTEEFRVGAQVLATGWKPYDATKLDNLGYGQHPNVVTGQDIESMAKSGQIVRPSDKQAVNSVVFVQCAGSRDPDHLPYCSSTCCVASLKQALYIREQYKDARVYVVYKDMRTPGHFEDFYKTAQENEGIFLTKGEIEAVSTNGGNEVTVSVKDTLLGEDIDIQADLVVLATGMVPNYTDGELRRACQDTLTKAEEDESKIEEAKEAQEILDNLGDITLHLQYRQGPDLPELKYGFPDSHFICFPYESRRTGIYPCGTVRKPMNEVECYNDAAGAALKAIQCIELVSRGEAVHPRVGDQTFPELYLERCTQCKRCTEECPFGMYDEDEKGTPKPNITRCRRCAICMGSCPERIISFKNYSVDIIGSMLKAIEVPEEDEEKPRILVFICENDALPVVDMAGLNRLEYSSYVRFIPVRCLGSFNIVWIADALAGGIDGIMLIGCKHGDDYQCHFVRGSELADIRMEKVSETLQRLVLESERIEVHQLSIDEYSKLPELINDFEETLDGLGPNPYKDF